MFGPADLEKVRDETRKLERQHFIERLKKLHSFRSKADGLVVKVLSIERLIEELESHCTASDRKKAEGTDWANVPKVNITGGMESSEYIRRLRED